MDAARKNSSADTLQPHSMGRADRSTSRGGYALGVPAVGSDLLTTFDSIFQQLTPPAEAQSSSNRSLAETDRPSHSDEDARPEPVNGREESEEEEPVDSSRDARIPPDAVAVLEQPAEPASLDEETATEKTAVEVSDEPVAAPEQAEDRETDAEIPAESSDAGELPLQIAGAATVTVDQPASAEVVEQAEVSVDPATLTAVGDDAAQGIPVGQKSIEPSLPDPAILDSPPMPDAAEQGEGQENLSSDGAAKTPPVVQAEDTLPTDPSAPRQDAAQKTARESRLDHRKDPRDRSSASAAQDAAAADRGRGESPQMSEMHAVEPYALEMQETQAAGLAEVDAASATESILARDSGKFAAAAGADLVSKKPAGDAPTRVADVDADFSIDGGGEARRGTGAEETVGEKRIGGSSNDARVRLVQRVTRAFQRLGPDGGRVHIMLHPAELGSVRLDLSIDGNRVDASMRVENEAALEILRQHLPELRQRMVESGLVVDRIDVELADQFESHGGSTGDDRQEQNQQQTAVTRRVHSAAAEGAVRVNSPDPRPRGASGLRGRSALDLTA